MVEFRFDIKHLFPQPVIKVASNLLPHTFSGDRREVLDATTKISEIIDTLGQLSAVAQKLNNPVTTSQRLRLSDHQKIYFLADVKSGRNGVILGILKVGTKDLYLFDEAGNSRKVDQTPCILDFYIHESRQRSGLGLELFETMLADENWMPMKCSIDRPSEKLLAFLAKHYGLKRVIPQANNFVIYEGFFDKSQEERALAPVNIMHITNSPNTQLFGAHFFGTEYGNPRRSRQNDVNAQISQIQPAGRYGAPRPHCSMAEIIQGGVSPTIKDPKTGRRDSEELLSENAVERATAQMEQQLNLQDEIEVTSLTANDQDEEEETTVAVVTTDAEIESEESTNHEKPQLFQNNIYDIASKKTSFQLNKQHTGMKNRSCGVGMAVTPTQKMEFNQEEREDFGVVKINRPVGKSNSANADIADNMSTTSSTGEGLTEHGYHDLKFYHNRLW